MYFLIFSSALFHATVLHIAPVKIPVSFLSPVIRLYWLLQQLCLGFHCQSSARGPLKISEHCRRSTTALPIEWARKGNDGYSGPLWDYKRSSRGEINHGDYKHYCTGMEDGTHSRVLALGMSSRLLSFEVEATMTYERIRWMRMKDTVLHFSCCSRCLCRGVWRCQYRQILHQAQSLPSVTSVPVLTFTESTRSYMYVPTALLPMPGTTTAIAVWILLDSERWKL